MSDQRIATPSQPSIVSQAAQVRENQKATKINGLANTIVQSLKQQIWEANIEVGEYTVLMQAVTDKMRDWYNSQINARKTQDVLKDPSDTTTASTKSSTTES